MVTAGRLQGHGWASDGGAEAQRRRAAGGRAGLEAARTRCFAARRSAASSPAQKAVAAGAGVGVVCVGVRVCGCVGVLVRVCVCVCARERGVGEWGGGSSWGRVVETQESSARAAS